jgi:hypothetical protein
MCGFDAGFFLHHIIGFWVCVLVPFMTGPAGVRSAWRYYFVRFVYLTVLLNLLITWHTSSGADCSHLGDPNGARTS